METYYFNKMLRMKTSTEEQLDWVLAKRFSDV